VQPRIRIVTSSLIAVFSFNCLADNSQIERDDNIPITLQDYLRYAALNNAGLEAAFEQWKAAVEQIPQAKALPDPRFNYGYFIEEVETRVGPQRQKFDIMQTFPWFGTIEARTDQATATAKAAHKLYMAKRLELF
jgi:cobalt-zinc-cadmium efflux system outer membrane protein